MKKKIIYIKQHSVFSTDGNNGRVWREEKHVNWLLEEGYHVSWWYSSFDHYHKVQRSKVPHLIEVEYKKFWVPIYKKNVSLMRVIGNIIFSLKVFINLFIKQRSIEKIICAYPTPESSLAVAIIAKIFKKDLIIDIRDNWPESLNIYKKFSFNIYIFKKYVDLINKITFNLCNKYIGMSDGILRKVKNHRSGDSNNEIFTIPNSIDIKLLKSRKTNNSINEFRLTFFGTLNSQFTFKPLHDVCNKINAKYPKIKLTIIGSGEQFKRLSDEFAIYNCIEFLGQMNQRDLLKVADQSFGFFCFYSHPQNYENHFTNKLVEYISLDKPFIHNLKTEFTLNRLLLNIGHSLRDISLYNFIEKSFTKKLKNQSNNLFKYFDEQKNKKLFLELLK